MRQGRTRSGSNENPSDSSEEGCIKSRKERSRSKEQRAQKEVKRELKLDTAMSIEGKLSAPSTGKQQVNREKQFLFIKDLPKRPQRSSTYKQVSRDLQLVTNNYPVLYRKDGKIVVYVVKFFPQVFAANKQLKREIVKGLESPLRAILGHFVFYNTFIIAAIETQEAQVRLKESLNIELIEYAIELRKIKVVRMADVEKIEPDACSGPQAFFNYIIKDFFKNLNYFEQGRQRKFHDISSRKCIPDTELSIIPGYAARFQNNEAGFMFKIDVSHRIVRTTTALEFIDRTYKEQLDKRRCKEDIRRYVCYQMAQQMVLANYGTYRTYQVETLLFDVCTNEFKVDVSDSIGRPVQITLDQYFKERYQYDIRNKRAPLIVYHDQKVNRKLYLVPELCIMSGVPDDLSDHARRQVQKECQGGPRDRLFKIKKMQSELFRKQPVEGLTMEKLRSAFGIDISQTPISIKAKQLKPPDVHFGNATITPSGDKENFNFSLSNQLAFCRLYDVRYGIIFVPELDINYFCKNLERITRELGVRLKNQTLTLRLSERRHTQITEIENYIKGLEKDVNIVIIILNRYLKPFYAQLKKLCISEQCAVLSQMVLIDTLNKKGTSAVIQKIAIQVLEKVGNPIWCVKPPQMWPENTLIVCAISERTITGVLSNVDKIYSRYYSQAMLRSEEKSIIKGIGNIIANACKIYMEANGQYPERVIYFREGLQDEGIHGVVQVETPEILKAIQLLNPSFKDKFSVINIANTMVTKLFREEGENIYNAPAGTLVDSTIVSSNYEFLLVPVYSSRGCPKPIQYKVLVDRLDIPMEQLQDFVYGQCYNYQNWVGSIKLPAIVKNCQRMVRFLNDMAQQDIVQKLRQHYFYL